MFVGVIGSAGGLVVIALLIGAWQGWQEDRDQREGRRLAHESVLREVEVLRVRGHLRRVVAARRGELGGEVERDPIEYVRRLP